MPDSISDDFAIANGVAAFALAQETLKYLERAGLPRQAIVDITAAAHQTAQTWSKAKRHRALPIAADLLGEVVRRLRATMPPKH